MTDDLPVGWSHRRSDRVGLGPNAADLAIFGLLRMEQTTDTRFRFEVRQELSAPLGNLYGGIGVAACAEATERVTQRPLQWITTQFLDPATCPDVVDLEVTLGAHGRTSTQSHVVGTVDGRPVFMSLCAHSRRPGGDRAQFAEMPDVFGPDDPPLGSDPFESVPPGTFLDQIERRWATNRPTSDVLESSRRGRLALWCRLRDGYIGSPATQAFVSDIIPIAVCAALDVRPGGISLDNTVRILDPEPSEWVLLDMIPDGFHRSIGHGSLRVWSQNGRLMGTAQQSSIIRVDQLGFDDDRPPGSGLEQ